MNGVLNIFSRVYYPCTFLHRIINLTLTRCGCFYILFCGFIVGPILSCMACYWEQYCISYGCTFIVTRPISLANFTRQTGALMPFPSRLGVNVDDHHDECFKEYFRGNLLTCLTTPFIPLVVWRVPGKQLDGTVYKISTYKYMCTGWH